MRSWVTVEFAPNNDNNDNRYCNNNKIIIEEGRNTGVQGDRIMESG